MGSGEHIFNREPWDKAKQHIEIAQTEIGIQDQDPFPKFAQSHAHIGHHIGFPYSTFSA